MYNIPETFTDNFKYKAGTIAYTDSEVYFYCKNFLSIFPLYFLLFHDFYIFIIFSFIFYFYIFILDSKKFNFRSRHVDETPRYRENETMEYFALHRKPCSIIEIQTRL